MLLELIGINKSFGGLHVLSDISFNIDSGEIVGLLGPNGAGKTTLFNVITGIYRPETGSVRYQGQNLVGLKPHQISRKGIARTFQLVRTFPSMTTFNNILVGSLYGKKGGIKQSKTEAMQCLEVLGLQNLKDTVTAHLTFSDRRLVEIARAIAAKPGIVLLDEPLAGLNPAETEKIMGIIQDIREKYGISIFWIEHKMSAIFKICDRIVVLDYGKKLADAHPKEIAKDKKVLEAYLGEPST